MACAKLKCCNCKGRFPREDMISLPVGKFCSQDCVVEYAINKGKKNTETKAKKDHALRKKVFYANDLKLRKRSAQKAFNAFIRERDKLDGCISCDKPYNWDGQWHAGHFKTVGARSDLRFNEDNCHKQCSVCNNFMSGNIGNYTNSLVKKIGIKRMDALMLRGGTKKTTCEDYKEIENYYKRKLKELNNTC